MIDPAKRAALESAGFRASDAEDFLGLTEDERREVERQLPERRAMKEAHEESISDRLDRIVGALASRITDVLVADTGDPEIPASHANFDALIVVAARVYARWCGQGNDRQFERQLTTEASSGMSRGHAEWKKSRIKNAIESINKMAEEGGERWERIAKELGA